MKAKSLLISISFFLSVYQAFSADRFWVGNTGNWGDASNWSANSGGTGGASIPTTSDDVYFDTSSFTLVGQIVTINVNASCNNMYWTGALNSPSLSGGPAVDLTIAGTEFFLIDAMTFNFTGNSIFTNTSDIDLELSASASTFGNVEFTATSSRVVDINGNGNRNFGRIVVGNSTTINFNGSGSKTLNGYFTGLNVLSDFTGDVTLTDTLSTGKDNDFTTETTSSNTYVTFLVGEIDNGSRNHRYQGSNVFNGEVITANDYQNTDRVHFYNSIFNDKVTITAPDGRAQFRENSVFNDTLLAEANTSLRFFDVDTFNSVVIMTDDNFFYLSQNNSAADYSVFNDSVFLGPDMDFRAYRDAIFNAPVYFSGNDNNSVARIFNDGNGSTEFNDKVWFANGTGSAGGRWIFERQVNFNADVEVANNTFLYFGDASGTTNFNDNLTIGNNNDLYFERNWACDSLTVIGNQNLIQADNTCDFDLLDVGDQNTFYFRRNVDFNDNAVFADTNAIEFSELGGEVDAYNNLTFGSANDIIFHRRLDFSPAAPGDSLYLGTLSSAEFDDPTQNGYFEDLILANESRASFKNGDNRFDNIYINDFSTIELSANGTNTVVGEFIANETCTTPPIVRSGTGGQRAVLDFTNIAPTWSNVIVQDLEVTSSNILTIDAAVNNGNLDSLDDSTPNPGPPLAGATIWITNDRPGTTLYWIGSSTTGAGINWSDASNWSTSSGGAPSICVPTPKDDVVFDANSFNAPGEQVLIDASFVICNDMTWTGVTAGVQLSGNTTNTIFMTGDLSLDANMSNNFYGTFEFNANDTNTRTIDPNGVDFLGPLTFNYLGGNWDFEDDIVAGGTVTISDGTVDATSNNYNLTVNGTGSDLLLSRSGRLLCHDNTLTVDDLVVLEDSTSILFENGQFDAGGDLEMSDTTLLRLNSTNTSFGGIATLDDFAILTQDAGTLDFGGAFTASDEVYLEFDTVEIIIDGNLNMNDDVVLQVDSSSFLISGAMNANNDAVEVLGGSSITVNGGDFYIQDDASATMLYGSITVNGDQFFLDDNAQFIDTGSVIIANNDFLLQDNTIFSSEGGSIEVQSDDFFLDLNCVFTLNNGFVLVDGDDMYLDDNAQATFDNCSIVANDLVRVENNSILTLSNNCIFDIDGTFDMNNSATVNANDALIYINASLDFETNCTFNEGTSTVTFDGDVTNSNIRTRGEDLYNLVIDKDVSTSDVRVINNSFVIGNNLHILTGEFWDSDEGNDGPYQITGNTSGTGTLIVEASGALFLGDDNGGSDAPTTFPTGWASVDITLDDSSTVYYIQRLAGTPQIISPTPTYGNLTLNNSNGPLYTKVSGGPVTIEGILFIDDNIQWADSGYQITGNANAWTEFEMDANSILSIGSATSATTLPTFPVRDWDQRSTIDYSAGVPQSVLSISGGGNDNSYGRLTISNSSTNTSLVNKTLAGVIQVRRQLSIDSYSNLVDNGFQITGNTTGEDLIMASNSQLTIGTAAINTLFPTGYTTGNIDFDINSLVVYNSDLDQDISDNPNYANLQMSSTGAVIKSLTGNTTVNGDLIIDADNALTTTGSSYDISIGGDWNNSGTFSPNLGSVTFDGSALSSITGSTETDFYDLIIDNTAADSAVKLFIRADVMNALTLTDGIVVTNSGNELIIADDATASSGSDQSHIDGPMIKVGDDDFNFPVGDMGKWARIGISHLQNGPSATDSIIAQYIQGLHPEAFWNDTDYVGTTDGLENTSIVEYWEIDRLSGTVLPKISLYWSDNTESYITDTADLTVAHYLGGNAWKNEGGSAFGALASGYVRTLSNITSFSPFTFGSTLRAVNPLPIELLSFDAEAKGKMVELTWSTLSEINNDYFTIERSKDAKSFEAVFEVDGAGNSRERIDYSNYDDDPYLGTSYYRLKQTDFDGKYSYSKIRAVSINANNDNTLTFYPNPARSGDVLRFSRPIQGKVFNANGKLLFDLPPRSTELKLERLPSGLYFIQAIDEKSVPFVIY